MGELL